MKFDFNNMHWFENVENRQHPWPGLNWLTAMLYVPNVEKAIDFYSKAFTFVPIFQAPTQEGRSIEFARMRYRGSNFTLNKEGSFDYEGRAPKTSNVLPPCMFYVYVDDVDAFVKKAVEHGAELIQSPRVEFWGNKKARLRDPFGYIWEFATRVL